MKVVYSLEQRQWLLDQAPGYFARMDVRGDATRYAHQQADLFYTMWPILHDTRGTPLINRAMVKMV
jgi:hypothetical protein